MKAINQVGELDTPSDLKEKGREKVAEALNRLVADAFALYIKTKNYHWHVSGRHFRDYHLLLDEQAEQIFATIDPLAERVRKIGANTIRSVAHIAQLQRVKDNDEDFVAPKDMLLDLLAENEKMAKAMRDAHQIADDAEDVATASLLENFIDETERRIWFLFETTRDLN
ncbi:DNA starvation/stationary phase protection protein [Spirosoma flavus]